MGSTIRRIRSDVVDHDFEELRSRVGDARRRADHNSAEVQRAHNRRAGQVEELRTQRAQLGVFTTEVRELHERNQEIQAEGSEWIKSLERSLEEVRSLAAETRSAGDRSDQESAQSRTKGEVGRILY